MASCQTHVEEVKDTIADYEKAKKALLEAADTQTSSEELNIESLIVNLSKGSVKLIDMHFWKGQTRTGYHSIPVGYQAHTLQKGTLPEGVKFGLFYTDGTDADDANARRFVVAVDTPAAKIYVEAGPNFPVHWDSVEVKLDMAGPKAEFEDPILGGKVTAEILGVNAIAAFRN